MTSTITDYYWKVRFSQTDWTQVNHCRRSAFCTTITSVLPDGTKVQVSANGALITLEHRAGSNANDHAEFLFEVNLVKNSQPSVEHHIFDVKFTVICECTLFFIMSLLTDARQLQELRWATEIYNSFSPFENQTFSHAFGT